MPGENLKSCPISASPKKRNFIKYVCFVVKEKTTFLMKENMKNIDGFHYKRQNDWYQFSPLSFSQKQEMGTVSHCPLILYELCLPGFFHQKAISELYFFITF